MLDVIILSANDGLFWLIFHMELIRQGLVLQGGAEGEIDQFRLTICSF